MKNFCHDHVLELKGISFLSANFCLVFKWMENGDLRSYVKQHETSTAQLMQFCADIASGMAYLATQSVFHRDLAARNCLLDARLRVKGRFRLFSVRKAAIY